ncbi:MAG: hypothetical protein KatS3mg002_0567 [Candidatus Woesearchaeota archaeon]|nr:MAG: hypothetical protein KatS3mg002_0567 [Candidatus Woesearchaeota archaeon]
MKFEIFFSIIVFILVMHSVNALVPCLNDEYGLVYETVKISELCSELERETGVQTAIVLTNFSEDIDSYAIRLFDENKIGEKNKDNGILIVVNIQNNEWIILVGYGLEGVLNDAKLAEIGRTYLEPQIDEENYNDGIIDTFAILAYTIYDSGEFKKEKNFWKDNRHIILAIVILIFLLIITKGKTFFLPSINKGFGGGRTGGGRGKR